MLPPISPGPPPRARSKSSPLFPPASPLTPKKPSLSLCSLMKPSISAPRTFPPQPAHVAPQFSVKSPMPRPAKSPSSNSRFGLFFASLLFYVLTSFSLVACSRTAPPDPSSLTLIIESNPANLDPRFATDPQSQDIDGLLFSSLLERDNQMNFHGDLAESWNTPDPLTYIFHLRRGIRFHDGRPLTSADIKATFDFILDPANHSPKRGGFRNARIDALTDQIRVEMDKEKRKALCSEVQKISAEDLPYLPLWLSDVVSVDRRFTPIGSREGSGELNLSPTGDFDFLVTLASAD